MKLAIKTGAPFAGNYLVDGDGNTLCYFAKDLPAGGGNCAISHCVANPDPNQSCLAFWPIFHADRVIVEGFNANAVGQFTRPDGFVQTTYRGFPLYHFVGDQTAGDVNGEGSTGGGPTPVWFVVRTRRTPSWCSARPTRRATISSRAVASACMSSPRIRWARPRPRRSVTATMRA